MTGGNPETRSNKSFTNGPVDQWINGPMDIRYSLVILMTSIALILFKRLRVTLVTSIASRD